jgi:Zn-dependent protease
VSSSYIEPVRNCHNCGHASALGSLECEQCHALLHSEDLLRISTKAKSLEEQNNPAAARLEWLQALRLLPQKSQQAEWVRGQIYKLELAANRATTTPAPRPWTKWLGPLAPVAVLLAKGKSLLFLLFKLKFLLSLIAFMSLYWTLYGAKFGIGFVLLIFIHEMGHYIDIRRRGLPAEMPVFLPGLGAYVRWQALGVSRQTRAAVSLAGPLAGLLAAIACLLLWWRTGDGIWAALTRSGAWLNAFNLIPVWLFDGGQATSCVQKKERFALLVVSLLCAIFAHEPVFYFIAAGAIWRLFTKDLPPLPGWSTTLYYASVMAGLAIVLALVPGKGFAGR